MISPQKDTTEVIRRLRRSAPPHPDPDSNRFSKVMGVTTATLSSRPPLKDRHT